MQPTVVHHRVAVAEDVIVSVIKKTMDILYKSILAPIHSFEEMIVIASPCVTMKMERRTEIHPFLLYHIHRHCPQSRPNVAPMLSPVKKLGVKLL